MNPPNQKRQSKTWTWTTTAKEDLIKTERENEIVYNSLKKKFKGQKEICGRKMGLRKKVNEEEADLGFQLERHAVADVVDELLEAEELDGAKRAPVTPVDVDLQFARLVQVDAETLVPRLPQNQNALLNFISFIQ